MKLFISQPMAGLTDEKIRERREELIQLVKKKFSEDIEVIDSFTKSEEIVGRGRIAMLGDSIMKMYDADMVIFASDWRRSAGCNVEHEVCKQYCIPRLYEEDLVVQEEYQHHVFWR
jgi:hypothetical protein